MILGAHARWRDFRRLFSRSEWMVRLLGLPRLPPQGDATPGLVMIQIDGLSHPEMQRALRDGEMPFLSKLVKRENYAVRKMYSGLPSNTPSMQGELFYGVPCAVPAFGFLHKDCTRICRMLQSDTAKEIEAGLAEKGEPLLKDGSAYSNIYTGGAREPRWCAASMGWGTSTKSPGPFLIALLALINFYGFLRAFAFALLEIVIATVDAIRGVFDGNRPKHEFKFIFPRVGVCVILREWITHASRMDITRGLPIVHVNFVGYDEQSHHRGPDSAFAHWVLGGIDDSIKRIWRAAKNSDRRPYEVWIYSDHGQVRSTPYLDATGTKLIDRVNQLWNEDNGQGETTGASPEPSSPVSRWPRWLGGGWLKSLSSWNGAHGPNKPAEESAGSYPITSDYGPLALVYLGPDASAESRARLGERLAREAGAPIVIDAKGGVPLRGWTSEGPFTLPDDAERLLGNHPFREALIPDLERVCRHERVGDLVLLGWKGGMERPLSFAYEYGAHGGISPDECTAFVAMPADTERELLSPEAIRPADLRRAVLQQQGREEAAEAVPRVPPRTGGRVRVMTYNVHSCIGLDQRHDPRRIARVIAHYHPDIICLQELDVGHARSSGVHQARQIASLLRLEYHFHSVREVEDQQFGNAILSRYPLQIVRVGPLPTVKNRRGVERRGALWVEVDTPAGPVQVLNTHLGLWPDERSLQMRAILSDSWLGSREKDVPLIVCGDLNCGPGSAPYRDLSGPLRDCQLQVPGNKPRNTWFSRWPLRRLDHIFVAPPLEARHIHIPTFDLARTASDHLPLVADIALPVAEGGEPSPVQSEPAQAEASPPRE